MNSPLREYRHGHGTEMRQRVLANASEQFYAADVTFTRSAILASEFLGDLQGVANKQVGLTVVALVACQDHFQRFIETYFVHVKDAVVQGPGRADGRRDRFSRPIRSAASRVQCSKPTVPVSSTSSRGGI